MIDKYEIICSFVISFVCFVCVFEFSPGNVKVKVRLIQLHTHTHTHINTRTYIYTYTHVEYMILPSLFSPAPFLPREGGGTAKFESVTFQPHTHTHRIYIYIYTYLYVYLCYTGLFSLKKPCKLIQTASVWITQTRAWLLFLRSKRMMINDNDFIMILLLITIMINDISI